MTAFLPQNDPARSERSLGLDLARVAYRYDYTHVSPLAMADHVPINDQFSLEWAISVAERVKIGIANLAELDLDPARRRFHLAKLTLVESLLERAQANVVALRQVITEALRFEPLLAAPPSHAQSLDDYGALFRKIGLPPIARDFQQDAVFAAMRVAGPNPVMIKRMTAPDERLAVTDADLAAVAPTDSLAAAIAEGRLYLADYAVLDGIELGDFPHGQKYVYAPLAMFVVEKSSKQLLPVAIQCRQKPAADNPIFTCCDGKNWLIAKTIVEIADGNVHEAMTHLGKTHLLMEPFVVATHRQLAARHPLFLLLAPHFEGTLSINDAAWKYLIANNGVVDKLLAGSIRATRELAAAAVQARFEEAQLPKALAARGVDDADCLPCYPYRDDAILYWNAIQKWVVEYLATYYAGDADVQGDDELQAWFAELHSSDGGRINGLGRSPTIATRADLAATLTTIIYTCSVQHAAVNFPQFDLMSYVPNMPLAGYSPAPTAKKGGTDADYRAMLPPLDMAELQLNLAFLLGGIHYTTLGAYRPNHFDDPRVLGPLGRFQAAIQDIGAAIHERNLARRPYGFLSPAGIPQSINI